MVSTIKLDIIAFIDERFVEFSENYYFTLDKLKKIVDKTEDEIKTSLLLDVRKYVKLNNLYKALKRYTFNASTPATFVVSSLESFSCSTFVSDSVGE